MVAMERQKIEEESMKALLILYLEQYCKKRRRKEILQQRLKNFREEMMGAKAIRYSSMPHSCTNSIANEPLDFRIKCEEIEERIEKEREEAAAAMLMVMDVLSLLEPESEEKNILEYRYLDGCSWKETMERASMSRSRCNDYWKNGLEKLLGYAKVRNILEKFGEKLDENETERCDKGIQ